VIASLLNYIESDKYAYRKREEKITHCASKENNENKIVTENRDEIKKAGTSTVLPMGERGPEQPSAAFSDSSAAVR
jgi:hypothetical protein